MTTSSLESGPEKPMMKPQSTWLTKTKLIIGGVMIAVVALAIGLGVGLGVGLKHSSKDKSTHATSPAISTPVRNLTANSTAIWQPTAGTTWQYDIFSPLASSETKDIDVWIIDLFNNDASIIQGLQSNGAKVVCYFSAGSYENWRPDIESFTDSDLGKTLDGWPNEKWIDTNSDNVRNIMLARLDMAVDKNCDGVDPDNVDAYDNDNGLNLTEESAVEYVSFLAQAAAERNLSIGLKNAGAIISNVIDLVQWSVNEQCEQFNECETYAPFIKQDKPVFHVEYPKGDNTNNDEDVSAAVKAKICDNSAAAGFSTIIKNIDLDSWLEAC